LAFEVFFLGTAIEDQPVDRAGAGRDAGTDPDMVAIAVQTRRSRLPLDL